MTTYAKNFYIGIDVSKAYLDVFVLPVNKYFQFSNDTKGFRRLINAVKFYDALIVMEATGGYENNLASFLIAANFAVSIVNPRHIRNFAKAMGKLAKTDKIDAKIIALYAEKIQPRTSIVANENQEHLNNYVTRRRQLIDMIVREKNRLDGSNKFTKKSIKKHIKYLEKELGLLEEEIRITIQKDEKFVTKEQLLKSIKGIGTVAATTILAKLPELGQLDRKQIAALAGLAPYNNDSGFMRGKRMIWGGRSEVRSALYMPTIVAIRHNEVIKEFYERLCANGKQKMVAIVACMRKILTIMNAMIRDNCVWREGAESMSRLREAHPTGLALT